MTSLISAIYTINIKTIIVTSASALLLAGSAVVATATSVNQNASALDETVSSGSVVIVIDPGVNP